MDVKTQTGLFATLASADKLCGSLRSLTLDGDQLWFSELKQVHKDSISSGISKLSQLQELNLCNMWLDVFPIELKKLSITLPDCNHFSVSPTQINNYWSAITKLNNLRSLQVESIMWTQSCPNNQLSVPTIWCTSLRELTFGIDGERGQSLALILDAEVQHSTRILDALLSSCTELKFVNVYGNYWKSEMRWPASVLELHLGMSETNDPPQDALEGMLKYLPRFLRELHVSWTIMEVSGYRKVSDLARFMFERLGDFSLLERLQIDDWDEVQCDAESEKEEGSDGNVEEAGADTSGPEKSAIDRLNDLLPGRPVRSIRKNTLIIMFPRYS
jgi:hypothetical protein